MATSVRTPRRAAAPPRTERQTRTQASAPTEAKARTAGPRTEEPARTAAPADDGATDRAPEGRSARKRRAILEAATALFLANGYHGTNLDDVAARAAVSKQTVYKNFADKNRLFTEIVLGIADDIGDRFRDMTRALQQTDNLERDLREFARQYVAAVIQPQVLQPRRLVIAESNQFPELARTYYQRAPERAINALAECIEHLAHRGLLQVEDPRLAADQLAYLVLAVPLDKAMFYGDQANFRKAELERLKL